jgi:hypothetical protein
LRIANGLRRNESKPGRIETGENAMNRSTITCTSIATLLVLASMTAGAAAQSINKQDLIGTWTLVSTNNMKADGTKVDVFGANAKGILIFDQGGHYSLTIVRSDLPKVAGGASDKGTAEENRAILAGLISSFGTYTLNDKTLTTHVEGSSFPNISGGEQKRIISTLTKDELKYTNPVTATGMKAEAVWNRTK